MRGAWPLSLPERWPLMEQCSSQIMVHVKTLRNQAVHPSAAHSPLVSPAPPSETLQQLPVGSCFVQICGDVIGMFFWHSGSTLRIWNWKTGALVVVSPYSIPSFLVVLNAALVSE